MLMSDTSAAARSVQLRAQRRMSGEQRLLTALEMSLFARELTKAGIRHEHPDWEECAVSREWLRLSFLPHALPAGL